MSVLALQELQHGFQVIDHPIASLNTLYEWSGEFDGFPLFRGLGGGKPGLYYHAKHSKWLFLTNYTEEVAKERRANSSIVAKDGTVPLGGQTWSCWVDSEWRDHTCTIITLSAAELEQAKATAAEVALVAAAAAAAAEAAHKEAAQRQALEVRPH